MSKKYEDIIIEDLVKEFPFVENFFSQNNLEIENRTVSFYDYLKGIDDEDSEDNAIDKNILLNNLGTFIEQMKEFLGEKEDEGVRKVSLFPGTNKFKEAEQFEVLNMVPGEIISIVGPTGSGKSRLLADIEWVAQNDTPTSRTVLINDEKPDPKWRFSSSSKLVAQLSQNMNFVMDLSAYEFVELHAKSRLIPNAEEVIEKILKQANELAGEEFAPDTPITSLSGGQSRALMIADTAILSKSPIILIDEIENAGIDRKKALELLVGEEKIVFMATHDPILALMGDRRIVIRNGGIDKILETTDQERNFLTELEKMDVVIQNMRTKLRYGETLTSLY